MNTSDVALIVNPRAGHGRAAAFLPHLATALRTAGLPRQIHLTSERGEATALAKSLAEGGAQAVVAVGGDGTVNEVANGLMAAGRPAALGVIAAGRGNDFARSAGLPTDIASALAAVVAGGCRRIDVGRATAADGASRIFVNHGGLGLDARISARAAASRLPGSTLPYLGAVAGELARLRAVPMNLNVDGNRIEGRFCLVLAANGDRLAGGMRFTPGADIADGLLDLVLIGDVGRLDLLRQVPGVYRGTHLTHPAVRHLTGRVFRVEAAEPVPAELEGEAFGASPVTFTVEPGALLLIDRPDWRGRPT
jgi:diacylglycerol kinase (ATP)